MSKEDWVEWLRELSIELLRASPSPALRSCLSLAQSYNPLAKLAMPLVTRFPLHTFVLKQGLVSLLCVLTGFTHIMSHFLCDITFLLLPHFLCCDILCIIISVMLLLICCHISYVVTFYVLSFLSCCYFSSVVTFYVLSFLSCYFSSLVTFLML